MVNAHHTNCFLFRCSWRAQSAWADQPPNIVLLIGDDHGYPYFGFMGDETVITPSMDALA